MVCRCIDSSSAVRALRPPSGPVRPAIRPLVRRPLVGWSAAQSRATHTRTLASCCDSASHPIPSHPIPPSVLRSAPLVPCRCSSRLLPLRSASSIRRPDSRLSRCCCGWLCRLTPLRRGALRPNLLQSMESAQGKARATRPSRCVKATSHTAADGSVDKHPTSKCTRRTAELAHCDRRATAEAHRRTAHRRNASSETRVDGWKQAERSDQMSRLRQRNGAEQCSRIKLGRSQSETMPWDSRRVVLRPNQTDS